MLFLIISVIVFITIALFVPKKLPKSELYAIALFSILLGFFSDITLDLKYHLYGYFNPGVQFSGFLPILFLFPSSGVLFMNFYPFRKSLGKQLLYLFGWTVFCLIFEYLSILSGYFYHNGWNYWLSAVTYPFLLLLHLLHLKTFRIYLQKE
ncbi:CBO0543 family protein [Fredinandcohnia humi]